MAHSGDDAVKHLHAAVGDAVDGKIDSDALADLVASAAPTLSERQAEVVSILIEARCVCMQRCGEKGAKGCG